jgi:hypothetical protein
VIDRAGCIVEKTISVPVFTMTVPNIITPGVAEGINDKFLIQFGRENKGQNDIQTPRDYGLRVAVFIYNRWGKIVYETQDYQYDWSGDGLPSGVYYYEVKVEGYPACKSWINIMR